MKIIESNICLIKLQTSNLKDEIQTLRLINVYNSCSLSIIFTEESSTISRLNKLIKDDCKQLIVEDFNLHHSYWEDRRCFTHHTATDALLDIIMNARLELLLESGTITRKTHNQLTTINLAFDSEKIQFIIHKCKMRIDLHQRSDYLSIVMKLCLRTSFVQLTTHRLWKKMNIEALNAHLRIHLFVDRFLDDKTAIDDRVTEITHVLQEIIEKFTSWAKSLIQAWDFWNQICSKVMTKSWWLQVVWKSQSTLEAWNDYLRYNDHKNKIIKETKRSYFKSQMHELSNELKSIWCFAKWVRIESQLLKKLSQFSSLKSDDFDHIADSFKEKTKMLWKKFFSSSSQANINNISKSFISLTVLFNSVLSQDEMRQMIQWVKVDKASDTFEISNKALQMSLTELTSILINLFNACVTHKYHSKQFKKAQTIVLRKSKKSDYIDSKTYRFIALLNIMNKTLKSIMIKRLSDIAETYHMLSNVQMRARRKRFVISALNLLVDQVHVVWGCEIKYVAFMLSLNITETFDHVLHTRLLHTLRMKRTSNYIVKWTCSFLKDRELLLTFNEQTSAMQWVNADILQKSFISSILFLFFNASLIEKCEALEIKIEVLDFVNDINILIYDRITESICESLSQVHDVCTKWAWTHDATFASEKYELTHFIHKSKRFDMTVNLRIKNTVIKSKLNVRVLEVQLNMKLWWDSHLRQIEVDHVIKMLMLSQLEIFIWETTFAKARQIYSAMIRLKMTFEASIWHQRNKEEKLSNMKWRLETLQNQALRHVINVFRKVNIKTLKVETYTFSLHVHLNKLQN